MTAKMSFKEIITSMKHTVLFGALLALSCLVIRGAQAQQDRADEPDKNKARYAVLTFNTADFGQLYYGAWWTTFHPRLTNGISDQLTTDMVKAGFDVIERSRIEDLKQEQELVKAGTVDPATAAEVGKVLGVQYVVIGTLTEWGMKERTYAGGALFGNVLGGAGIKQVEARAVINFRVVDTTTGRIVAADEVEGKQTNTGVIAGGILGGNILGGAATSDEWWSSQIGKATRKAVHNIVGKIAGRRNGEMLILAMADPDHFVVELDDSFKLHKGQQMQIYRIKSVTRNDRGVVVFTQTEKIGSAQVEEIQEEDKHPISALLHITDRTGGAEIKVGCLVKGK
jgi:curli biogenesis system outer membrane secretion channel CsgG